MLGLLLASCEDKPAREYQGALYFGQGAYLMRYSLGDGGLSIAGHLGDTTIRQVTALGNDDLLVAELASVNRQRVSRISWIDPRTGETADLYAGIRAEHLADPGVVVYDDGSALYAVPQRSASDNEIIFTHSQKALAGLLEASPGILLIGTGDSDQAAIHLWDARTGNLRELTGLAASCRLAGAVWIGHLERLACKQRSGPLAESEYVLADLEGRVDGRLNLPEGGEFFGLAYIERYHAVLLQETRAGWLGMRKQHVVWMHELDSGENHRVARKLNLGDSVVYAEY
jgi:hypothetical protein